jgi:hypothetical protein
VEPEEDDRPHRGPVVRRLTAEQFVDALCTVANVWPNKPAFNPAAGNAVKLPTAKARWIWNTPTAHQSAPPGTVYFRKEVALDDVTSGELIITADNAFVLCVNGQRVASSDEWGKPVAVDLKPYLVSNAKNVLAVEAENTTNNPNPAGLFLAGRIAHRKVTGNPPLVLASDKSWLATSEKPPANWTRRDFTPANWRPAFELGDEKMGPWRLNTHLAAGAQVAASAEARSALCTADPLTTALGRTNREQVMTDRATVATTLQGLEMSNGNTLAQLLKTAAGKLTAETPDRDQLITRLFIRALSRQPSDGERTTAKELLGSTPTAESVEDLLWILAMLPEFQLIR